MSEDSRSAHRTADQRAAATAGPGNPERWSRIERLLASAFDLPPDQRAAFLQAAYAAEPSLEPEIEALVAAGERPGPVDLPVASVKALLADLEAEPPQAVLAPGDRVGPYVIQESLGSGGMGQVFRARDTRLARDVALKVVGPHLQNDAPSQSRLGREARTIAALSHPNVIAVHDIGEENGLAYLVTELLSGRTLRHRLREGALDEKSVVDLGVQIACGLTAAHALGIVHRDLKPENLFITNDGVVKILDFGLAKAHSSQAASAGAFVTAPHTVLGTLGYMSPEQISGDPVDARSDLFALGAVLYEAATGHAAFQGETRSAITAAILATPPALPDDAPISAALAQAIFRCLARSPAARYQTAADLEFTLRLFGGAPPASDTRGRAPLTRAPRPPRMRRFVGSAAVLASVGAVILIGLNRASTGVPAPIAFTLHAPSGSEFGRLTMDPEPALSPDGRHLAFVTGSGSTQELWVQTLGELRARRLARTGEPALPFWSPDGQFVAFRSAQGLQKVASSGDRAPQNLCACDAEWGGTWGPDGTIVFAGSAGLFLLAAEGMEPSPLSQVDSSRGEFSHRFPLLLPDGRHFLYLIRSSREEFRGIHLGSLADRSLKQRLLPDDSNVAYGLGPDGRAYLFFVRDRLLLAQPFDLARRTLLLDPVVLAQPVVPGEAGRLAPMSAAGRSLVYRIRHHSRTPLFWMSRGGVRGGRIGVPDASYRAPALSPDGTRLAVLLADRQSAKPDVWVVDLSRQVSERLTWDPVGAWFPHWLPDGRRLVFSSAREGAWNLFWHSFADGRTLPLVEADVPWEKFPSAVTRDGRFVVFQQARQKLWLVPLTGDRRPHPLVDGWHGRVSPDGRWLAYVTEETGESQVYVTTFPTTSERWRISTNGGVDPQWRSDGRELFFVSGDRMLTAVPVRQGSRFEAGRPSLLFRVWPDPDEAGYEALYAATPDGERFIVTEAMDDHGRLDGARERLLTVTMNWTPPSQ